NPGQALTTKGKVFHHQFDFGAFFQFGHFLFQLSAFSIQLSAMKEKNRRRYSSCRMRQSPAAAGYPASSYFFWIPDSRFAPSGMTD
ncbi:MAG: hypothetical protein OES18_15535, partial [Deltaproteobacteria bacterium]|nr:hypothetical protein [Deltaproteobacteria bacterium]